MTERHLHIERRARYFMLGPEQAEQVWVVLHGYGQLAVHFLRRFRRLDDGTRRLVAPEALSRFYLGGTGGSVGASWMTRVDREAEIADTMGYLDAVWDEVAPAGGRDRSLVVFGFSQGAASAARWAVHRVAQPDRLVLWGGFIPADMELGALRERLRDKELTIVVGDQDEYIASEHLADERKRLQEGGIRTEWVEYAGGHAIDPAVLERVARPERSPAAPTAG